MGDYVRPKIFNSLPNGKILAKSILKAFADDKLKLAQMASFVQDRVEYNVGQVENAGYQQFFLFLTMFSTGPFPGIIW